MLWICSISRVARFIVVLSVVVVDARGLNCTCGHVASDAIAASWIAKQRNLHVLAAQGRLAATAVQELGNICCCAAFSDDEGRCCFSDSDQLLAEEKSYGKATPLGGVRTSLDGISSLLRSAKDYLRKPVKTANCFRAGGLNSLPWGYSTGYAARPRFLADVVKGFPVQGPGFLGYLIGVCSVLLCCCLSSLFLSTGRCFGGKLQRKRDGAPSIPALMSMSPKEDHEEDHENSKPPASSRAAPKGSGGGTYSALATDDRSRRQLVCTMTQNQSIADIKKFFEAQPGFKKLAGPTHTGGKCYLEFLDQRSAEAAEQEARAKGYTVAFAPSTSWRQRKGSMQTYGYNLIRNCVFCSVIVNLLIILTFGLSLLALAHNKSAGFTAHLVGHSWWHRWAPLILLGLLCVLVVPGLMLYWCWWSVVNMKNMCRCTPPPNVNQNKRVQNYNLLGYDTVFPIMDSNTGQYGGLRPKNLMAIRAPYAERDNKEPIHSATCCAGCCTACFCCVVLLFLTATILLMTLSYLVLPSAGTPQSGGSTTLTLGNLTWASLTEAGQGFRLYTELVYDTSYPAPFYGAPTPSWVVTLMDVLLVAICSLFVLPFIFKYKIMPSWVAKVSRGSFMSPGGKQADDPLIGTTVNNTNPDEGENGEPPGRGRVESVDAQSGQKIYTVRYQDFEEDYTSAELQNLQKNGKAATVSSDNSALFQVSTNPAACLAIGAGIFLAALIFAAACLAWQSAAAVDPWTIQASNEICRNYSHPMRHSPYSLCVKNANVLAIIAPPPATTAWVFNTTTISTVSVTTITTTVSSTIPVIAFGGPITSSTTNNPNPSLSTLRRLQAAVPAPTSAPAAVPIPKPQASVVTMLTAPGNLGDMAVQVLSTFGGSKGMSLMISPIGNGTQEVHVIDSVVNNSFKLTSGLLNYQPTGSTIVSTKAYTCSTGSGASCLACRPQEQRTSNGQCVHCNSGYFISGTSCQACKSVCNSCTRRSNCVECKNSTYLFNGDCVASCPSGFYPSGVETKGRSCEACKSDCNNCTSGSDCTECKNSMYLFNDDCVASCPSGFYHSGFVTMGRSCEAYTCSTGSGASCLACRPQAQRTSNGQCVSCNSGYFISGTSCQAIVKGKLKLNVPKGVAEIDVPEPEKNKVNDGFKALKKHSVSDLGKSLERRLASHSRRTAATVAPLMCDNFNAQSLLNVFILPDLFRNMVQCAQHLGAIAMDEVGFRADLPSSANIRQAENNTVIAVLSAGHVVSSAFEDISPSRILATSANGSAYFVSGLATSANGSVSNPSNLLLYNAMKFTHAANSEIDFRVQACAPDCNTCTSGSDCTQCTNSTYLSNGGCVASCPSGFYPSGFGTMGRSCKACKLNCNICTSGAACTECQNSMYLSNGDCVASCPSGSGFYASGFGTMGRSCEVTTTTTTFIPYAAWWRAIGGAHPGAAAYVLDVDPPYNGAQVFGDSCALTEALCVETASWDPKSSCTCSGESARDRNDRDIGSFCKKWSTTDAESWCFVAPTINCSGSTAKIADHLGRKRSAGPCGLAPALVDPRSKVLLLGKNLYGTILTSACVLGGLAILTAMCICCFVNYEASAVTYKLTPQEQYEALPIEEKFRWAQLEITHLLNDDVSPEDLADIYAYYNQARRGDAVGGGPARQGSHEYKNWSRWKGKTGMPKEEAMRRYVDLVYKIADFPMPTVGCCGGDGCFFEIFGCWPMRKDAGLSGEDGLGFVHHVKRTCCGETSHGAHPDGL